MDLTKLTDKIVLLAQLKTNIKKTKEWVNNLLKNYALKTDLPTDYLTAEQLAAYFNDVAYDSDGKKIQFKHDTSVVKELDATPFIKDGMVNTVTITDGKTGGSNNGKKVLLITFNTDSGKEDIEIPLDGIFDASNYYNKTEADGKFLTETNLEGYAKTEDVVAKATYETDKATFETKANAAATYQPKGDYLTEEVIQVATDSDIEAAWAAED